MKLMSNATNKTDKHTTIMIKTIKIFVFALLFNKSREGWAGCIGRVSWQCATNTLSEKEIHVI